LAGCATGDGAESRGDGDGVEDRTSDGVGNGIDVGDGDGIGNGEGRSTNGSSVGCVSVVLDFPLGVGAGVRLAADPGSDQLPTLFPLAKVVWNLV